MCDPVLGVVQVDPCGVEGQPLSPPRVLGEQRARLGGDGVSDEELLLRWLLDEAEIAEMRAAAPPRAYVSARPPVVSLVEQLVKRDDLGHVRVAKGGIALTLDRTD